MTPIELKALDHVVSNTDFIPTLRSERPELTADEWLVAKGWEKCVDHIIRMVTEPEPEEKPLPHFVDVSKL